MTVLPTPQYPKTGDSPQTIHFPPFKTTALVLGLSHSWLSSCVVVMRQQFSCKA